MKTSTNKAELVKIYNELDKKIREIAGDVGVVPNEDDVEEKLGKKLFRYKRGGKDGMNFAKVEVWKGDILVWTWKDDNWDKWKDHICYTTGISEKLICKIKQAYESR